MTHTSKVQKAIRKNTPNAFRYFDSNFTLRHSRGIPVLFIIKINIIIFVIVLMIRSNKMLYLGMGLEPVALQLEHNATKRSRKHHSTHLALDGWNGGCDFGL